MDAEAADASLIQGAPGIGRRRGSDVKGFSIILHADLQNVVITGQGDVNIVLPVILEPMVNHVGKQLFKNQVYLFQLSPGTVNGAG